MSHPFHNPTAAMNFDHLFLPSLMGRLQLRPPPQTPLPHHHPLLSQSFEDLLLEGGDFSFSDEEEDEEEDFDPFVDPRTTNLSKEESKLEKELVKIILSGETQVLKPNSGQAISVGEHHVCVGFHEETGAEYRVWEWHGHIMLFEEENGYTPEYIYGNYFERRNRKEKQREEEEEETKTEEKLGLRELIENEEETANRVLHQRRMAGSTR